MCDTTYHLHEDMHCEDSGMPVSSIRDKILFCEPTSEMTAVTQPPFHTGKEEIVT